PAAELLEEMTADAQFPEFLTSPGALQLPVREGRQEFRKLRIGGHLFQEFGGGFELAGGDALLAQFAAELNQFLADETPDQFGGQDAAVGKGGLVVNPLPELGAADFGGGSVFHEIVNGHASL